MNETAGARRKTLLNREHQISATTRNILPHTRKKVKGVCALSAPSVFDVCAEMAECVPRGCRELAPRRSDVTPFFRGIGVFVWTAPGFSGFLPNRLRVKNTFGEVRTKETHGTSDTFY